MLMRHLVFNTLAATDKGKGVLTRTAFAAALALLSTQAAPGGYDNGNGDASKVAAMAAHRRSDVYVAADLPESVSDASTISCNPDDLMCEYSTADAAAVQNRAGTAG